MCLLLFSILFRKKKQRKKTDKLMLEAETLDEDFSGPTISFNLLVACV